MTRALGRDVRLREARVMTRTSTLAAGTYRVGDLELTRVG